MKVCQKSNFANKGFKKSNFVLNMTVIAIDILPLSSEESWGLFPQTPCFTERSTAGSAPFLINNQVHLLLKAVKIFLNLLIFVM